MLRHKIFAERWFAWTLVFLVVAGLGLISYIEWVAIEISTENALAASEYNFPKNR